METLSLLTYPIIFSEHMLQPNYDDVRADFNAYKLWVQGGLQIDFSEHYAFVTGQGTWRSVSGLMASPG